VNLLIDANLSPRVGRALSRSGHDAVHVFDVGLGVASDLVILEFASRERRTIVSSDSDFVTLTRHRNRRPSFVLLRHQSDLTVDQQIALLRRSPPLGADELEAGAVVPLARGRIRTRRLPFSSNRTDPFETRRPPSPLGTPKVGATSSRKPWQAPRRPHVCNDRRTSFIGTTRCRSSVGLCSNSGPK
jgi:predicted nuclease of predicted toxin-antitoxin system